MVEVEVIVMANNTVIPFQQFDVDFIDIDKLFVSKLIAEHGLGFLINIYENPDKNSLLKQFIFDTGGPNHTFIHNLDVFSYPIYDIEAIILSHWHYDHYGSLYPLLERIERKINIYTHKSAQFERIFKRSRHLKNSDLDGKTREELIPLLNSSKIINQEPIDLQRIEELNGDTKFLETYYLIFENESLKIIVSGEIPRNRNEENFDNYFSIQEGFSNIDKILDDKCLIFEFNDNVLVLNGCCHSGLMNTIDYVKNITKKPISHIIGGFHMASATDQRIITSLDYISELDKYNDKIYLFPLHCSGEKILQLARKYESSGIKCSDVSVGANFHF